VDVRRQRQHDLTGDGRPENVAITARGPLYRDLDIRLVITGAAGDTLWADTWRSEFYFHYDDISQRTDDEVARSVREQVDDLLTDRRFHHRGMPPGMIGGDATDIMRESVRYHLAELDWRRRVDLEPADATPGYAHDRIDPAPCRWSGCRPSWTSCCRVRRTAGLQAARRRTSLAGACASRRSSGSLPAAERLRHER
jgi:hypothetical protein